MVDLSIVLTLRVPHVRNGFHVLQASKKQKRCSRPSCSKDGPLLQDVLCLPDHVADLARVSPLPNDYHTV